MRIKTDKQKNLQEQVKFQHEERFYQTFSFRNFPICSQSLSYKAIIDKLTLRNQQNLEQTDCSFEENKPQSSMQRQRLLFQFTLSTLEDSILFAFLLQISSMYPSLDNRNSLTQTTFKKTLPPSEEITNAVLNIRKVMPNISSFKPHLNTHECHFNMIINNKINVPVKIVFLRNFPQEKPLLFITQWIKHPLVNQNSCQIQYEREFPWTPTADLGELLKRIQNKFSQTLPTYDSELEKAYQAMENYGKNVESLRTKPMGTQPPPLPNVNLESTLKTFEYQENLHSQCEQKNSLYQITAQEYNENLSRVKCMSEKFGKGKILREMEKQIESEISNNNKGNMQEFLQNYFENRKKLHKMKILKELYLES